MSNIKEINEKLQLLQSNIEKVIIGKTDVVKKALVTLLARGHLLIEDVPGVGKTTLAQSLSESLNLLFKRIQFTSDILPTDITGVSVYDQKAGEFEFRQGPLFANLVLADEINRAAPKTQSALLEAMNDNQVSVDNITHHLPDPFTVIATQNPMEYYGTYPLPESQLDRFMMKIKMGYPSNSHEKKMFVEKGSGIQNIHLKPVLNASDLVEMQKMVDNVKIEDSLVDYMMSIIQATRGSKHLGLGISPRGGLIYQRAVRAYAFLSGRNYVIPDDFKELAVPILAHRVIVNTRHGSGLRRIEDAEIIVNELVNSISVPL